MSETRVLENDSLLLEVSDHGAEPVRIYDKKKHQEVLYDADPAFWKRHAPVLFPIVGVVKGNSYLYNGKEYSMGQHGVARDQEFTCEKQTGSEVTHVLCDTEETRKKYPFSFRFTVTHTLEGSSVLVSWKVEAVNGPLCFKLGAHPAFRVPVLPDTSLTDYWLDLNGKEEIQYYLIAPGTGCVDNTVSYSLKTDYGCYPLSEELFAKDALIVDGQLSSVSILYPDKTPYITVDCAGFPNFGIWKMPGAPFVCLEPWFGRTDNLSSPASFTEKEGMTKLNQNEAFSLSYRISIQ